MVNFREPTITEEILAFDFLDFDTKAAELNDRTNNATLSARLLLADITQICLDEPS